MSIGGPASTPLDTAINNSIADGVTYVVAAGNSSADACTMSPARAPDALTVGATTSTDARRASSNFGSCVDLFAPGASDHVGVEHVATRRRTRSAARRWRRHTSPASPRSTCRRRPQASPATIAGRILADATTGRVTGAGAGSPNRLLFSLGAGASEFAGWAASSGVQTVNGDFNGDGFGDIALVGGFGWGTIPIAFATGNGRFDVSNKAVPNFPGWAQVSGATPVPGDYNKDGRTDIALVGGSGWGTVPIAFSNGDGTFNVTNSAVPNIPGWAQAGGAKPVAGDFNKDGYADIALVGGSGWGTIPIAFSYGNGTFLVTNSAVPNIPGWAQVSGAKPVAGDFNKDGYSDIALVGGSGWGSVPIAFSYGNGTFQVTNSAVPNIPGWAQTSGAKPVAGDFNKDGYSDIALVGGSGWGSVPIAFSYGNGTFQVTNSAVPNIPGWAQTSGAKPVAGDFNKDGYADIALVGGSGWGSVPIAFSYGNGTFQVTNSSID